VQIWERLRGSLDDSGRRNTTCPSGLHPDGTCSCESVLTNEESSTRASISRIVMLAEALFEVVFFSELADCLCMGSLSLSLSLLFSQFTLVFGQRWKLMLSKNFKLRSVSADHFIWTLYQGSTSMVWDQVSWGLHVGVSHTLFHRINLGLFGILLEYFTMLHVAFEKIIRLIFF